MSKYGKEINGSIILKNKNQIIENGNPALRYETDEVLATFGWYPLLIPGYDPATDRLGPIEWSAQNKVYFRAPVSLTSEEQEEYQQQLIDNDDSARSTLLRRNDGKKIYERIMAIIERRFRNNTYSGALAKGLMQYFDDNCSALFRGNWPAAQKNLDDNPITQNQQAINFYTDIKSFVDNYVVENY